MTYHVNTYHKIKSITKKIKLIQGGLGAGKSVSIAQILIEEGLKERQLITVITYNQNYLKDGAVTDFRIMFEAEGLDWENAYSKARMDLTVGESTIQFRSILGKKENTSKYKKQDILYINDGDRLCWEDASDYVKRTRGDVYIDYNPVFAFWAHTEIPKLRDEQGETMHEQIIATYLDNDMLPQGEVDFLESRRGNSEWFKVYGLGELIRKPSTD
jgi:phage terminase large subunit